MRAESVFQSVPVVSGFWSTSFVATINASDLSNEVPDALNAAADFFRAVEMPSVLIL